MQRKYLLQQETGEEYVWWVASWFVVLTNYYLGDNMVKDEMGGLEEKYVQGFGGEMWRNGATWKA